MPLKTASLMLAVLSLVLVGIPAAAGQNEDGFVPYERMIMVCVDPQADPFPPYGNLCSWTTGETELKRETTDRTIGEMALSPDGTKLVYLTLPDDYVAALHRGDDPTNATALATVGTEPSPTNTWLAALHLGRYPNNVGLIDLTLPLADGENAITIAEQALPPTAPEYAFQRRSLPVWSPDSTRIAWVELNLDTEMFDGRIMLYDTRTATLSVIAPSVGLGFSDGGELHISPLVGWGSLIAYLTADAGVYPDRIGSVLSVFDQNGTQTRTPLGYFADYDDRLVRIRWVQHRATWVLALTYLHSGWVVFDPLQATYSQLDHPPFMQAATGGNLTGIISEPAAYPPLTAWQGADLPTAMSVTDLPLTFAPTGHPIWRDENDQLVILDAGRLSPLLPLDAEMDITAAVWTPSVWIMDGAGSPTAPTIVP